MQNEFLNILCCEPKITFKPLQRNYYRCNQAPMAGKFTKKQVQTLLKMVSDERQKQKAAKQEAKTKKLLEATFDMDGDPLCPHCGAWNVYAVHGKNNCRECNGEFMVEYPMMGGVPSVSRDAEFDARCPNCRVYNFSVVLGENRCKYCGREFMVV
jgi:hypothetical protein